MKRMEEDAEAQEAAAAKQRALMEARRRPQTEEEKKEAFLQALYDMKIDPAFTWVQVRRPPARVPYLSLCAGACLPVRAVCRMGCLVARLVASGGYGTSAVARSNANVAYTCPPLPSALVPSAAETLIQVLRRVSNREEFKKIKTIDRREVWRDYVARCRDEARERKLEKVRLGRCWCHLCELAVALVGETRVFFC